MGGGLWHCTGSSDQDNPQEKEMQKGKMTKHWLRRFEKLNENENYIWMYSQRITRKDKTFLSYQYQEIEKINRMGKIQITSRKSEIPREIFMQRGTIKDRNGTNVTELEETKKGCKSMQINDTPKTFIIQLSMMVWSLS